MVRNSLGKIVKSSIFMLLALASLSCGYFSVLWNALLPLSQWLNALYFTIIQRDILTFCELFKSRLKPNVKRMNLLELWVQPVGKRNFGDEQEWSQERIFSLIMKASSELAFIRSSYPSKGIIIWILEYLDSFRMERLLNFFKTNIVTHFNLSLWRK